MRINVTAISDVGMVRQNNEDMILIGDEFIRDSIFQPTVLDTNRPILIAVSDGMGGHNAGELASEFVLRKFNSKISGIDFANGTIKNQIDSISKDIHESLVTLGKTNPQLEGLGCTFTGLLFHSAAVYLIHAGDSRLYRIRGSFLNRLTKDHTLRELLKDDSIPGNKLINCFGANGAEVSIDFEDVTSRISDGDKLLLCSDGLTGEFTDEEFASAAENLDQLRLVNMAKAKGGRDNISCVIVAVEVV